MLKKTLLICLLAAALLFCAVALAENYPQSSHPYPDNADQTWTYVHPEDVYAMKIVFSAESKLELGCDFLSITDGNDITTDYTGEIGGSMWIMGSSFTLHLSSDGSVNEYGFAIESITGYTQEEYENRLPESSHPYPDNTDQTWTYTHPEDAEMLKIAFSSNSGLDSGDYLYITDADDNTTAYTGNSIAGAEIWLPGSSFTLRLTSDAYGNAYGFTIDKVTAYTREEYENRLPESAHPYPNNANQTWTYTHPEDAYVLVVKFSQKSTLENEYDYLYLRDAAGNTTAYTGDSLSGASVLAFGNSFTLRLTSDSDYTKYGFAIESITAYSQEEFESGSTLSFNIDEYGCITGYTGAALQAVIPESIDGITVTDIGSNAFRNSIFCSIELPEGVTNIGSNAFDGSIFLREIILPSTLSSIGDYAFYNCKSLTDISLPAALTYLGEYAFCSCEKLQSISVPAGLSEIQNYTFSECKALSEISIAPGVTSIKSFAFEDCESLVSVSLPNTLQNIENAAFFACKSLPQINIPGSVTYIGNSAFSDCSSLASIVLPDNLTSLSWNTFAFCTSLNSIDLPDNLISIGDNVFDRCTSLIGIDIPGSVTSIGHGAFSNSGLTTISLPDSVTTISSWAFHGCSRLVNVVLPDSITSIGSEAFSNCRSLKIIQLPSGLESLDYGAFMDCTSLEEINLSSSLSEIHSETFRNCRSLTSVFLPSSLTHIHSEAFIGCDSLKRLLIPANASEIAVNAFEKDILLLVYSGSAAETFAGENGFDYRIVDDSAPAIQGFNFIPAESCVGSTFTWSINYESSTQDLAAFELYRNNCLYIETDWKNVDDSNGSFTHTFTLPGIYHLVAKIKDIETGAEDQLASDSMHVRLAGSDELEIFDAALITSAETVAGSSIEWSFKLSGGAGNYSIFPNIVCNGAENQNSTCASITFDTWDRGSYTYFRGSFIPSKSGEYSLRILAMDDNGSLVIAEIFESVNVSAAPVRITGITGIDEYQVCYINTETAELHLDLETEGDTDGLIYDWTLLRQSNGAFVVVDQFITDAPETDYTLVYQGSLRLDVRAYDPAAKVYSEARSVDFTVYPMEDYLSNGSLWGIYSESIAHQVGSEIHWYADYDDAYPCEFKYVLYRDGKALDESSWTTDDTYSIVPDETGIYTLECRLREANGTVFGPLMSDRVQVVDSIPSSITINYLSQDFLNPTRNTHQWYISYDSEHMDTDCRFDLYRNGEPYLSTGWENSIYDAEFKHTFTAYGEYTAYATFRDSNGNVSSPIAFEPVEFTAPVIDCVAPATYNSILETGSLFGFSCSAHYGVGNLHAVFTLYKDGEAIQTSPMIPMSVDQEESIPLGIWNLTAAEAGNYSVSAMVVDELGSASEPRRSGSVIVTGETNETPVLEYVTASSETSTEAATAVWTAVAYGGTSSLQYQFTLYCDGEIIRTYDWQDSAALSVVFPATGYYHVSVRAQDAAGNISESIDGPAISVSGRILTVSITPGANDVLTTGHSFRIAADIYPADVSDPELLYSSSNEDVAVVDAYGYVEIRGNGSTVITISADDGSSVQAQINVTCDESISAVFDLPAAISEIKSEAFINLQPVVVNISADHTSLADRAFAGCESLRCVILPDSAAFGSNVFEGCSNVVLFCSSDAQVQYAVDNAIAYVMAN